MVGKWNTVSGLWLDVESCGEDGASKCTRMFVAPPGGDSTSLIMVDSLVMLSMSVVVMVTRDSVTAFVLLMLPPSMNVAAARLFSESVSTPNDSNFPEEPPRTFDLLRLARFSGTELHHENTGETSTGGVSMTKVGRFISSRWNAAMSTSSVDDVLVVL